MKCPKCGYTSFDYLNACKKCGADLSDVRSLLGVISISPDERAASTPAAIQANKEVMEEAPMQEEVEPSFGGNSGFLGDNLGADAEQESFASLVQPTSFGDDEELDIPSLSPEPPKAQAAPAAKPAQAKPAQGNDEEFLDLDFGGIFEEEEK